MQWAAQRLLCLTANYTALESGVLDGGENAAGNVLNDKFYEVSGYFSMTQHFRPPGICRFDKYEDLGFTFI